MTKILKITVWSLVMVAILGLGSCQDSDFSDQEDAINASSELKKADMNVFYSSTQPLGGGVVRAWVQVDKAGNPMAVGVNLSAKALMNLPEEVVQLALELPKTKGHHFYTHALVDWNPGGHPPLNVYTIEHFDFHFYILSNEERMDIPFRNPDTYMDPAPANMYIPENYFQTGGLEPEMGAHWIDLTSPEFNGGTFTKTFIWGSYQGHFIFWEPMITLEYLMGNPDDVIPIPQPEAFETAGWYATDYVIKYSENPDEYTVALVNLEYHNAGE